MADLHTLRNLRERVQKATGPDRELDLDLARALAPFVIVLRRHSESGQNIEHTYWEYTGSMDAAIALIERRFPGCYFALGKGRLRACEPLYGVILYEGRLSPVKNEIGEGEHDRSLALAACAALLDAEQRRERGEGESDG